MKNRTLIMVVIVVVLGICVSAITYILGQSRAEGVFAGNLDVNALQRKVDGGESMLVYFYGRSCEDCAASEPYLTEALTNMPQITAYKCERDANATVRSIYGIEGTPTLVWFKGGVEETRLEGPLFSTEEYSGFLRGLENEN